MNAATEKLFALAPTPQAMLTLNSTDILEIIRQVGLAPTKTKYLLGLSKMIVDEFNGEIPNTLAGLEKLPGVGRKTASVVMSQVFGEPSFAVDTHVHRLALRWGFSTHTKDADKVQADLCAAFPPLSWNKLHLQWIYFGREYCSAKMHKPSECPICSVINKEAPLESHLDDCDFTPKKKAKGIIFYADRIDELVTSPELAVLTPVLTPVVITEEQLSVSVKTEDAARKSDAAVVTSVVTRVRRKRTTKK